jgi:hypothetical protein
LPCLLTMLSSFTYFRLQKIKLFYIFPSSENSARLQTDSDAIVNWATSWQLSLAISKCSVLYLGKNNPNLPHTVNNVQLSIAPSPIRDLGIWIKNDLSFDEHISTICRSANGAIFSVLRALKCHDHLVLLRAFTTYVRPLLEFSSSVFNPHFVYQIEAIEKIQRDFTRIIFHRCFPHIASQSMPSYLERLYQLRLETLEKRRLKSDLCLTFKILRGEMGNKDKLFKLIKSRTRGAPLKFQSEIAVVDYHYHFFTNRMARDYLKLPSYCLNARSVESFKLRLSSVKLSDIFHFLHYV